MFKKHMITLSLVSLCNMLVLLGVIAWQMHGHLIQERKDIIRSQVESMSSLVEGIYHKVQQGKMTEQEAKQEALSLLASIRYLKDGYMWVTSLQGEMVMHPFVPGVESRLDLQDSNGKYFVRAFVQKANEGGGFVDYSWPKPGTETPLQKSSYVMLFKPWGWIISSGLYYDDLSDAVISQISTSVIVIAVLLFISVAMFLLISRFYLKEFRFRAIYDSLTGLYSRNYMDEVGVELSNRRKHKEQAAPLAAIFFDIDHFKRVNDEYGHKFGDLVLKKVGSILRKELRSNKFVFRYGGEEMVVLLFASEEDSYSIAERIRSSVHDYHFATPDQDLLQITLSAGVAIHVEQETLSDLLLRADQCMYLAKNRGRNRTVTESEFYAEPVVGKSA